MLLRLVKLNLSFCPGLTGSLSDLSGFSALQRLDLRCPFSKITGDLADLRTMNQLRFLELSNDQVTGKLESLLTLRSLSRLSLNGCHLITGDATTSVALMGLLTFASVRNCPRVRGLDALKLLRPDLGDIALKIDMRQTPTQLTRVKPPLHEC